MSTKGGIGTRPTVISSLAGLTVATGCGGPLATAGRRTAPASRQPTIGRKTHKGATHQGSQTAGPSRLPETHPEPFTDLWRSATRVGGMIGGVMRDMVSDGTVSSGMMLLTNKRGQGEYRGGLPQIKPKPVPEWPRRGSNPHTPFGIRDFKSRASASFATRPEGNRRGVVRSSVRRLQCRSTPSTAPTSHRQVLQTESVCDG